MTAQPAAQLPRVILFHGPIQHAATRVFRDYLCGAINQGVTDLSIYLSSTGGSIDDGIALYETLRAMPMRLTMHAVGPVASIAIPIFLAADNRIAAPGAYFHIHGYSWTYPQPATMQMDALEEAPKLMQQGIIWSKHILQTRTKFTAKELTDGNPVRGSIVLDAEAAKKKGIVSSVAEAKIPAGAQAFTVNWTP